MTVCAERIVIVSPVHTAEYLVPVTAKLSKRFYDVLGEDVANELVDWTQRRGHDLPDRSP